MNGNTQAVNTDAWFGKLQYSNTWGDVSEYGYAGVQSSGDPVAATVTQITAYVQDFGDRGPYIVRMEFTYSDTRIGNNGMEYVGLDSKDGITQASSITFLPGEIITGCCAWTDGWHDAYTNKGYRFWTSLQRELTLGTTTTSSTPAKLDTFGNLGDTDWVDIGSGLLIGARSGKGQRRFMSLLFLANVAAVQLDIPKDGYKDEVAHTESKIVDSFQVSNNSGAPKKLSVSYKHAYAETFQWGLSFTIGVKYTVSVKAAIPTLVEVGGSTEYSWSLTASTSSTKTETNELIWSQEGDAESGYVTTANCWLSKGLINTTYEGTLTVHMSDGKTFKAPVKGSFTGNPVGVNLVKWTRTPLKPSA